MGPASIITRFRRRLRGAGRRLRETRLVAQAFRTGRSPVLAHVVPVRRCNLACIYCNEFDDHSAPVPVDTLLRRIDHLAALGTTAIHLSGGEPLLHPGVDEIIRRIRSHGILAGLLTNGYLLSRDRIEALNRAGLDQLQISIDNVLPDEVSKKSLKVLDRKIELLAQTAEFDVNINSVMGSDVRHPGDALTVARRAADLGLIGTVGVIHDSNGRVQPLSPEQRRIYDQIIELVPDRFHSFARYNRFQENMIEGRPNDWHCRAGSRYLYVCEDGLVHWCSQRRGTPALPLESYDEEELERQFEADKPCAPYCTVGCVHRVAVLDQFRERPLETIVEMLAKDGAEGSLDDVPRAVRMLAWLFVTSRFAGFFKKAAGTLLGLRGQTDAGLRP
jgi:MoaA/NifB/PqqE/SkfB family radical SAM enzyme